LADWKLILLLPTPLLFLLLLLLLLWVVVMFYSTHPQDRVVRYGLGTIPNTDAVFQWRSVHAVYYTVRCCRCCCCCCWCWCCLPRAAAATFLAWVNLSHLLCLKVQQFGAHANTISDSRGGQLSQVEFMLLDNCCVLHPLLCTPRVLEAAELHPATHHGVARSVSYVITAIIMHKGLFMCLQF
jgi:hypothetical protein